MFDKLYANETVDRLKKIPLIVWYLFFAMASSFASLYTLYGLGPEYIKVFQDTIASQIDISNMKAFIVMAYVMTIIIDVVIFEVIAYVVYLIVAKRFFVDLGLRDFVFRLRLAMIMAYIIIGIVASFYFIFPVIQTITDAIINTAIKNIFLAFFMYEICKKFIVGGIAHKAYSYVARLYLTILIVLGVFELMSLIMFEQGPSLMEYMAVIGRLIINLATILLVNYQYNKLKNIPPPEQEIWKEVVKEDVIFKDFDF